MRRKWTKEELDLLEREYADCNTRDLVKKLGRSIDSIQIKAYIMGLRKSKERIRQRSIENGFQKGMTLRDRVGEERSNEIDKRRSEAMINLAKRERFRMLHGLDRISKMNCSIYNKRERNLFKRLRAQRYVLDIDAKIAYYTKDTKRAKTLEAGGGRHIFTFTFKPIEEKNRPEEIILKDSYYIGAVM